MTKTLAVALTLSLLSLAVLVYTRWHTRRLARWDEEARRRQAMRTERERWQAREDQRVCDELERLYEEEQ